MGFFIPGLGGNPGGGQPGTVTTVNGQTGNVLITAEGLGAVTNLVQAADKITIQSGGNDIGQLEIIEELDIENLINGLV